MRKLPVWSIRENQVKQRSLKMSCKSVSRVALVKEQLAFEIKLEIYNLQSTTATTYLFLPESSFPSCVYLVVLSCVEVLYPRC